MQLIWEVTDKASYHYSYGWIFVLVKLDKDWDICETLLNDSLSLFIVSLLNYSIVSLK